MAGSGLTETALLEAEIAPTARVDCRTADLNIVGLDQSAWNVRKPCVKIN